MLNPDTFKISKNGDPLIYRTPQNLKVIDIRPIEDDEPISTYVCKFKTYASLAVQKHLTATVEDEMTDNKKRKRKKISVPDEIHCYNLMFLDQCHLSDVFYKFNTKLMTKFVGNTSKVSASSSYTAIIFNFECNKTKSFIKTVKLSAYGSFCFFDIKVDQFFRLNKVRNFIFSSSFAIV